MVDISLIFECVGFHPFYDGRWLVPLHVSTDPPTLQVFDVTSEEPLPCSTQWPLQFDQLKAIASWKAREKETNSCYSFQLSASLMNSTLSVFTISICSFYMSFSMFWDWNWCPVRLNEHNECKSSGRFEDSFQEKECIYMIYIYDIYIYWFIYLFTIIQLEDRGIVSLRILSPFLGVAMAPRPSITWRWSQQYGWKLIHHVCIKKLDWVCPGISCVGM